MTRDVQIIAYNTGGQGRGGVEVTLKYLFYDFLGKLTLNVWVLENPTPKISVKNCGFNRDFTEIVYFWSSFLEI